ncbi:type IV pilus assembly protein PilB [Desulfacinum hydrothermale DSM 13146]|uniref:Type IV pilus assembly protein PilB n=1 Tax=Desulfacinum hydrothermale DSM 13146 TaxID=1121390 RepID=A0A1W1XC29_9BACT|nr:GspE/PulE family protein [Desulfacinum hydrothermale]SMC21605.1 type IV pilus assembly protein PilB [Desulfacinum hydrothermale DSM 13146]
MRHLKQKMGDILVREGLITEDQLHHVLQLQKKHRAYIPLGELCVKCRFISRSDLKRILQKYRIELPMGEVLLNMKIVTPEQLEEALAVQRKSHKKLGQILIEQGVITERDLVSVLSIQLGIPRILPNVGLVDKNLLNGLSPAFLRKNLVLPAFKEDSAVTVIMADPLDGELIRHLEQVFRCRVEPAIATWDEILKTINLQYHELELGPQVQPVEKPHLVIGEKSLLEAGADNVVEILNYVISNAILEGASDIHIEPMENRVRVRYRIDGIVHHRTDLPIALAPRLISRLKALCALDIAEKKRPQDGRIQARVMNKEFDLRVSTYVSMHGETVVIRILPRESTLIDLNALGFNPANLQTYKEILDYPQGVILVTGPTGSGKTTTLYASINYLNSMERVIMTVEDPIEYAIDGIVQGAVAPHLGLTYLDCIKAMMRQDPDVLMVGEIRDPTAAEAVIQASLTGHKVLTTFHTDDTAGALLRMMDMGIETFLISSTVVSVISQRLVRVLCPHCKVPYEPAKEELAFFSTIEPLDPKRYTFYAPEGCHHCYHTGYKGRTAVHELLVVNEPVRDAILARSTSGKIRRIAREHTRFVTMSEDAFYKATLGITSIAEIMRVIYHDATKGLAKRSAEEVIALCEGADWKGSSRQVAA